MTNTYLRIVLRCLLLVLWVPAIAFASTITLEKTLEGMTLTTLAIVFVLSTMAGATALLQRIDRELRDGLDKTLSRPMLFVFAHMFGSWVAGCLAFVVSEAGDVNDWAELGVIICASFAGAKFIEMISEKYTPGVLQPKPPVEH